MPQTIYSAKDLIELLRGEPGIHRVVYFNPSPDSMFDFGALKVWSIHGFMMLHARVVSDDNGATLYHDGLFIADSCSNGGPFSNSQALTVDQILDGLFPKEE